MMTKEKDPTFRIDRKRRSGYVVGIIIGLSLGLLGIVFLILSDTVALEYEKAENNYYESVSNSETETAANTLRNTKELKRELDVIRAVNFMCEKGCFFLFLAGAAVLCPSAMSLDLK